MGASWSKDREEYAYFTLPYRHETVKLFVKKGWSASIKLNTLSDLIGSKYILGVEKRLLLRRHLSGASLKIRVSEPTLVKLSI